MTFDVPPQEILTRDSVVSIDSNEISPLQFLLFRPYPLMLLFTSEYSIQLLVLLMWRMLVIRRNY